MKIKESIESLVNQLSGPVREELDALRAALDKHLAAVAASLEGRALRESLDTLVLDLSRAAAEQAEAAASRARLESLEAAQEELAAVQAATQKQVDAERAANSALRQSLDDAHQQLATIQAEAAALQAARIEIQSRLDQAEAAGRAQLDPLKKERTELLQARDEAAARLDAESRERIALTEALEAARQAANVFKADADRYQEEVEAARRYVLAMKEERERLKVEMLALIDERDREGAELAAPPNDSSPHGVGPVDAEPPASAQSVAREVSQSYPGPTRAAHRVPMPEGSEIVVDSAVCLLVNLSSQGAQIRSLRAMRPNHVARILLPRGGETVPCKGRIVWAVFEMPSAGGAAMYRAGVQFTEVDQRALDVFLLQGGGAERVPRSN